MSLPPRNAVVFTAAACLFVHGCTGESGDGGAVEASWNLYDEDGKKVTCDESHVDFVFLRYDVVGEGANAVQFKCSNQHGVTDFRVPEGTASLRLVPGCDATPSPVEAATDMYESPPEIVRMITAGDVVTLDTQVIQVKPGICP